MSQTSSPFGNANKSTVRVPVDLDAEEQLAGICAATAHGARRAHERLTAADFYSPACRRAFEVSVDPEVDAVEMAADISDWLRRVAAGEVAPDDLVVARLMEPGTPQMEARLRCIARLSGVPIDQLRRWVDQRPTAADKTGALAASVADAARRRRLMVMASDLHRCAGEGDPAHLHAVITDLYRSLQSEVSWNRSSDGHAA